MSLVAPSASARALAIVWLGAVSSWRWVFAASGVLALCGTLGLLFFALVTLSTMRLLRLAQQHCPGSDAVAAGLNVAIGGALAALLAMLLLWLASKK